MAYNVSRQPSFERRFKKCPPDIQLEVLDVIAPQIEANPRIGEQLRGNWRLYQSFHFHRKPEYRLIYRFYECRSSDQPAKCTLDYHTDCDPVVKTCHGLIDYVLIGTREQLNNDYKLDKKSIDRFNL